MLALFHSTYLSIFHKATVQYVTLFCPWRHSKSFQLRVLRISVTELQSTTRHWMMRRSFQLRGGQLYLLSDLMWLFGIPWKTGMCFSRPWLSEGLRTRQDSKINYKSAYTWFTCKILTGVRVNIVVFRDMTPCNLINRFSRIIGIHLPSTGTYSYSRRPTEYANVSKMCVESVECTVEFNGQLFKQTRDAIISINPSSSDFSIVSSWFRFQWMSVMLTRICEMPLTPLRIFYFIYD